jgi:3-hydroxyisobutyrate dehydrogenase-like beta-hydroxyacid dehydrogenase
VGCGAALDGFKEASDVKRIGFIGLGVMGSRMAARLVRCGCDLVVHDIRKAPVRALVRAGARAAGSAKAAAEGSDILISMLPGPAATREAVIGPQGAAAGLRPGSIVIDMSTSDPATTREIAARLRRAKASMLDAPVSGGMQGAQDGTLSIMVGGRPSVLRKVGPVLKHLGSRIHHVGPVGAGHTIKLLNNLLFAAIMAATAEAYALGRRCGIDPGTFREVVNTGTGRSFASEVKLRDFVIPNRFTPGFAVALQLKDLDLALGLGRELGAPMMLTAMVRELYQAVMASGRGHQDTSVIASYLGDTMGGAGAPGG